MDKKAYTLREVLAMHPDTKVYTNNRNLPTFVRSLRVTTFNFDDVTRDWFIASDPPPKPVVYETDVVDWGTQGLNGTWKYHCVPHLAPFIGRRVRVTVEAIDEGGES